MSQVNIPLSQHAGGDVALRVPVSFRLPPEITTAVGEYASSHSLSKTDAFVFFLQKGMDAVFAAPQDAKLDAIDRRLGRIEALLSER